MNGSMINVVFVEANKHQKAMVAHEKALEWQELFMFAIQNELSDAEIVEMAYRVAGGFSFHVYEKFGEKAH